MSSKISNTDKTNPPDANAIQEVHPGKGKNYYHIEFTYSRAEPNY